MRVVSGTRHDEAVVHSRCLWLPGRPGRIAALALAAAVLLCGTGCEEDESKPPRTTLPSIYTWALQFVGVASGQGVADVPAYVKGSGAKVLLLMFDVGVSTAWRYTAVQGVPPAWVPGQKSEVQLVAFIQDTENKTKWTYTNGGRFYHHVWTIELREALTGRLVARKTLAGDNDPPYMTTTTHPTDEHSIYPLFVAWLGGFVQ